jgi:AcrR family transcriptional regulator
MANPKKSPKQSSRAGRPSGLHVRGPGEGDVGAEGSLTADWQRRVVGRSLRSATKKSIDRGSGLIAAAATLLERRGGDGFTVQDVADEAGQSLRTLYLYFESKDDLLLAVFEEAIKNYATVVREAIADLDDELDRLAGAILTAALVPEFASSGLDVGLARLRLRLGAAEPQLMGESERPMLLLLAELTSDASRANAIRGIDHSEAAYLLGMINAGFITGRTLGHEYGGRPPDAHTLTRFCLLGLGADLDSSQLEGIGKRLRLPG